MKAIQNDSYTKGNSDYSCTELLKPPKIRKLTKKHWDDLEEDVEERLYSLYGQIAHLIIERASLYQDLYNATKKIINFLNSQEAPDANISYWKRKIASFLIWICDFLKSNGLGHDILLEERYTVEIMGKVISAQVDHLCLNEGILTDWKFTTAWKFKTDSLPSPDWEAQLNVQAYILRKNGFNPKGLQIVGLLRDYSKAEALRNESYPKHPVAVQPILDWGMEKTEKFIIERIKVHEKETPDPCSSLETWSTPDVWALMKHGRKTALKLYYSKDDLPDLNPGEYVEFRKGEPKRCKLYCSVNKFCDQFKGAST